jgi:hypothetical protein
LNFERKKVRGRSKRHYKEWHDTEGLGYRLTWRNEAFGVAVVPAFYACVKVVRLTDGFVWWNFCQHRRPYKTLKKAVEACLRNQKLWAAFIELGAASGRRGDRLKELVAKGMVGGGHILSTVPEWAKPKCDPTLLRMLYPACKADSCDDNENDQSDPTSPLPTTESESAGPTPSAPSNDSEITPASGPASNAAASGESTTRTTRRAQSKATSSATGSSAPSAVEPASGRKRKSKQPTAKPSTAGSKKPSASTPRKRSAKAASPSSPKKRSKR